MGKSTHFSGQPMYGQLINLLDKQKILDFGKNVGSERYVKSFDAWQHLMVMLYAVIKRLAFHEFYLKDTLKIVVNNDININFYQPDSQQGVKNTAAAQETDALVNVYTTSGRLLKARTKMSEALNGLEKGLYVVGRKLVRIKD